jgi:hypothetical protein
MLNISSLSSQLSWVRQLQHTLDPQNLFQPPSNHIWESLLMPRTSTCTCICTKNIVIDLTCRAFADMLAPHRKSKSTKSQSRPSLEATPTQSDTDDNNSSPAVVFPSSTELFYFYGQSLEQCAKLSTGQALFDLCTLHKKWLRIYAGV